MRVWPATLACLLLVAPACGVNDTRAPHGGRRAPSRLITMSSLGGIRLGEPRAAVERMLGHGRPVDRQPGWMSYATAALSVGYRDGRVQFIRTGSGRYHTADGLAVGAPVAAVRREPGARCIDLGAGAADCKLDRAGGTGAPPLLDVQLSDGVVRTVEVQAVNA